MSFILLLVFGLLASSLSLLLEFLFLSFFPLSLHFGSAFSFPLAFSFLVFAFIEELSKMILLIRYRTFSFLRQQRVVPLSTKIVYASCFGVGFSLLEGILSLQEGVSFTAILPFFNTTLLHIGTSFVLILSFFSHQERLSLFSYKNILLLLSIFSLHFLFNIIVFLQA